MTDLDDVGDVPDDEQINPGFPIDKDSIGQPDSDVDSKEFDDFIWEVGEWGFALHILSNWRRAVIGSSVPQALKDLHILCTMIIMGTSLDMPADDVFRKIFAAFAPCFASKQLHYPDEWVDSFSKAQNVPMKSLMILGIVVLDLVASKDEISLADGTWCTVEANGAIRFHVPFPPKLKALLERGKIRQSFTIGGP